MIQPVMAAATAGLSELCEEASIPESHGVGHALKVLAHAEAALAASATPLPPARQLAIKLAALLHDADDKKYFPAKSVPAYPNARRILSRVLGPTADSGASDGVAAEALKMIGWVSCSVNGNSCPPEAVDEPDLLWPRWADRLEAVGHRGVYRCWQVNTENGDALSVASTPRPASEEEVFALATPERFAQYQASGGGSASMMDHYYDKLLQVARPPTELVRNSYLEARAAEGVAPLVSICLAYGETGVVPEDQIRALAAKL
jgi:uncharacterized protein